MLLILSYVIATDDPNPSPEAVLSSVGRASFIASMTRVGAWIGERMAVDWGNNFVRGSVPSGESSSMAQKIGGSIFRGDAAIRSHDAKRETGKNIGMIIGAFTAPIVLDCSGPLLKSSKKVLKYWTSNDKDSLEKPSTCDYALTVTTCITGAFSAYSVRTIIKELKLM